MKCVVLMAITLDGKIAKGPSHFPDWTGKEDKQLFVRITRRAGAIIMGSKTFDIIGKPLPGRKNIVITRNKSRRSRWDNLIFTDGHPQKILQDLEAEGFEEVVLAGGALVNSIFAEYQLIDDIIVTISPKIFGSGISIFTAEISMELELVKFEPLGTNLICAHYRVLKKITTPDIA